MKQYGFCLIATVMPGGNAVGLPFCGGLLQKCIAQVPGGFFPAAAFFRSVRCDIATAAKQRDAQFFAQRCA
jgi:hypothetical protein